MTNPLLSLLQFSDGLFPSGGYAHSFGLESYVQDGVINDSKGVETFLQRFLEGTVGPCDAVAMVSAMAYARKNDMTACLALDATIEAMKGPTEFRQASREMGSSTLRTACALKRYAFLETVLRAVDAGQTPGHHSVAFGICGSVFGWRAHDAASAYLYSTASLIVGSALRLLPMGQLAGQHLLASLGPLIERLADQATEAPREDLWSFAPGIEIAGMRHAQLDARLFRS